MIFGINKLAFQPIVSLNSAKLTTFGQWATPALAVLAQKFILTVAQELDAAKLNACPAAAVPATSKSGITFSCNLTASRLVNMKN